MLYAVLGIVAAIENIIPPFPADVAVAFGAFVASRSGFRLPLVFLAAWFGNVVGALAVYELGRRYGARRFESQLAGTKAEERDTRIRLMFARYGLPALFLARFIPGVRALVPLVAGALKLPPLASGIMMAAAAAIWYGAITLIAFRFGSSWAELSAWMANYTAAVGVAATAILAVGLVVWAVVRRREGRP